MMNQSIDNRYQIFRRPHFNLVGDCLFFMASTRPFRCLSALEVEIWQELAYTPTVTDLVNRHSEDAILIIETFLKEEICERVERWDAKGRRRVIVVEPHADDAALSVGGTLWKRRAECYFIVATVASRSNFTSYYTLGRDYFNVDQVMTVRNDESKLFAAMIGGEHVELGMTDAVLRYDDSNWTLDFFKRHRIPISISTSRDPTSVERLRWTATISKFLAETPSEEIWMPLGSPHTDHALTLNSCIDAILLAPEKFKDRVIRIYQDVPYAARFPEFTPNMLSALRQAGFQLVLDEASIGAVFEQKLRLISLYASQFKLKALRADIEGSAAGSGPTTDAVERFWTIERMPTIPLSNVITPTSTGRLNNSEVAVDWIIRNKQSQKIRILLLVPSGQWRSDLALLCEAFPGAHFDLYVGPEAEAEVACVTSERVTVKSVKKGSKAWVAVAIKLACLQPAPTLFNAGERHKEAAWLSKGWFKSDTLVLQTMNELSRAFSVVDNHIGDTT